MPFSDHILVASHRRSGTHLTMDAIHNNFPGYTSSYVNLDRLASTHPDPLSVSDFNDRLSRSRRLLKTHMYPDVEAFFPSRPTSAELAEKLLNEAQVIYVYRDGRDVMTSLYYYLQDHHPDRMKGTSFSAFLRAERFLHNGHPPAAHSHAAYWNFHIKQWLDRPDVLHLSFEEMVMNYEAALEKIAEFLNLDMPTQITNVVRSRDIDPEDKLLRTLLTRMDGLYRRMLSVVGVRELTTTNFRKGTVGNYAKLFSREDLHYLNTVTDPKVKNLTYRE